MKQLSGIDAAFLYMETPETPMHVAGLTLYDPPADLKTSFHQHFTEFFKGRVHLIPIFGKKLAKTVFELDHPGWVDAGKLKFDYHIQSVKLPKPGSFEQVEELVAELHSQPLDLKKPLWQFHVIEGLKSGQVALYSKVHHAAIDGVSGAEILTLLLDPSPEGRVIKAADQGWRPDRAPGQVELLARTAFRAALSPARAVRLGLDVAKTVPALKPLSTLPALLGLGGDDPDVLSRPSLIAPRTVLNGEITPHRRWAYGRVELYTVKAVKNAHGVTVALSARSDPSAECRSQSALTVILSKSCPTSPPTMLTVALASQPWPETMSR